MQVGLYICGQSNNIWRISLSWETLGLFLQHALGHFPFKMWNCLISNICLYMSREYSCSQFILLLLSEVPASVNTRVMVLLAAIQIHAMTLPPLCSTDDVACCRSWTLYALLFSSFQYKFISVFIMFSQWCWLFLMFSNKVTFLFLNVIITK